ncbi:MAG: hypothetical protein Q9186_005981 [Xanthomendoza sp. 1 TL-2023]
MAEPVSFAASVIAVATLAEIVVTKGYRYLKAVVNCREDVRKLMAEANVLCGILARLAVLLQGRKRRSAVASATGPDDTNRESTGLESDSEIEGEEVDTSTVTLNTPNFIYECQRTLGQFQDILNKFGHTSNQSMQTTQQKHRFSITALRRLEPNDLKWPLSQSKTRELIASIERHKATCTLALAGDGVLGVHSVLKDTQLSNKYLAEIRAKQETMLKLQLNSEEEKALAWLSPVNPALKHRAFGQDRQDGTGMWLFDLPEMIAWLENPNDRLWIYGIPGAGKTTLSTLVVEEVLSRKRSRSIGTAYFYIRHDDKDTHNLSNLLGSLISQLASQNPEALAELMELRAESSTQGALAAPPSLEQLNQKLRDVSSHFTETYIMIDGLDECGSIMDPNRKRVVDAVAGLYGDRNYSIRTLVFSRDEHDIRNEFERTQFRTVSIAATSADLRLYVSAWLGTLGIRDETLKTEVLDTLVNEAHGMFMWVRAQIDYLQRLPNDLEKRKALRRLPPDLNQTYIRILETIESSYPIQTSKYIQRLLKWLVIADDVTLRLSIDGLCEAICVENVSDWPTKEAVPTKDQVIRWLGCLGRLDNEWNELKLSHFTVREFLWKETRTICSPALQEYFVVPEDRMYLLEVCLICVSHDQFRKDYFKNAPTESPDEIKSFLSAHSLYRYTVANLMKHIMLLDDNENYNNQLIQRFLSVPSSREFQLWVACYKECGTLLEGESYSKPELFSPVSFASATGLASQVSRLLEKGADADDREALKESGSTPVHLAISGLCLQFIPYSAQALVLEHPVCCDIEKARECSWKMVRMLVDSGADVNRQVLFEVHVVAVVEDDPFEPLIYCSIAVTPLTLALQCKDWRTASYLLDVRADWDATAQNTEAVDMCSVKRFIELRPDQMDVLRRTLEMSSQSGLTMNVVEEWTLQRDTDDMDTDDMDTDNMDTINGAQDLFVDAFSNARWPEVCDLLAQHADLNVNCLNKRGWSALHYASAYEGDALSVLVNHEVAVNQLTRDGATALSIASVQGCVRNMRLLLKSGANLELRDREAYTPLCLAVFYQRQDALQLLYEAGADINASLADGSTALHLAIQNRDTSMVTWLLAKGIDHCRPDDYEPQAYVNTTSLRHGTALYIAARKGHASIIKTLLDNGALINKAGPEDLRGSPLIAACAYGRCEAVEILLANGAALEVEGARYGSAEGTARALQKDDVLKILEQHKRTSESESQHTEIVNAELPIRTNKRGVEDDDGELLRVVRARTFNEEFT